MDDANDEFMRKLRATFQVEATDHVRSIVADIVALEHAGPDALAPGAQGILKTLHTLKGASRAVDLGDLELLCHSMEGLCSAWRDRRVLPDASQFDLLHQACELVAQLIDAPSGRVRNKALGLIHAFDELSAGTGAPAAAPAPAPPPAPPVRQAAPPPADAPETLEAEPDEPAGMPAPVGAKPDVLRIAGRDLDTIRYQSEALLSVELALQHQIASLQELAATMLNDSTGGANGQTFFEQVRQASGQLQGACARMGSIRAKLMDAVLDTAMVPFSSALEQLPGLIRNLARARGKEAVLTVRGDGILIDRRILEVVREAMLHLVTNAVDHGIEAPDVREAAGKPAEGQLHITIEQAGANRVVMTVTDDGAGLDVDAVSGAALRSNSITPEQLAALDPQQRVLLALRAGVSTSSELTSVSGRGVGLAIVADKVAAVDGELLLENRPGRGCRFELVLPVRLATMRVLLARCGEAQYALPLQGLEAVQKIADGAIRTVQGRETVTRAGRVLPLIRLARLFGEAGGRDGGDEVAVFVRSGASTFALLVDEVAGEQAILPKSLGKQLRRVRYFSGATQLGTGALLPLVALDDLARHALAPAAGPVEEAREERASSAARVLAVEDSITSRLLLKHILEGAGYQVDTAVDGLDAQSKLRVGTYDAVVSDIEMPGMDGLSLARSIRVNPKTQELPVVLVTSLQTAEERERGMLAGADAYVVKGAFDQDNLLATLRRLI